MGGGAPSALQVKRELLFAPFCGIRLTENRPMAKGVLLLRLIALRLLQGWARTDGLRAYLGKRRRLAGEILSVWRGKKISPVFVPTLIREHVVVVRHGITRIVRRVFPLCRFGVRLRTRGRDPYCATPKPLVPENLFDHTRLLDHCNDPHPVLAVWILQRIGVQHPQNHIPPFPERQFYRWGWGGRRTQRLGCDSSVCCHMTLPVHLVVEYHP